MVPGGYIEFQDYGAELFVADSSLSDGYNSQPATTTTPFERWFDLVATAGNHLGKPFNVAKRMKEWMEAVG